MKRMTSVLALLALLLSTFVLTLPAEAARNFNFKTGQWEEVAPGGMSRTSTIPRKLVDYVTSEVPGTIIVETGEHYLYFVLEDGKAMRYGIGVGRDGFQWSGTHRITRKAEWPGWTPPAQMRKRQPGLPAYMPGGIDNPLGARALYIGSTLYRLHGTSEPWTIGHDVSSGCIRLTNDDIIDLYDRARVGAKVIVHI